MMLPACDRETELLTALRDGEISDALREHALHCRMCQQTLPVAGALLAYANADAGIAKAPAVGRVWRGVQRRRQEAALRRASRAMLGMSALGVMYAIGALAWTVRLVWLARPEEGRQMLAAMSGGTVAMGAGLALTLLAAGAAMLMLAGQRAELRLFR